MNKKYFLSLILIFSSSVFAAGMADEVIPKEIILAQLNEYAFEKKDANALSELLENQRSQLTAIDLDVVLEKVLDEYNADLSLVGYRKIEHIVELLYEYGASQELVFIPAIETLMNVLEKNSLELHHADVVEKLLSKYYIFLDPGAVRDIALRLVEQYDYSMESFYKLLPIIEAFKENLDDDGGIDILPPLDNAVSALNHLVSLKSKEGVDKLLSKYNSGSRKIIPVDELNWANRRLANMYQNGGGTYAELKPIQELLYRYGASNQRYTLMPKVF